MQKIYFFLILLTCAQLTFAERQETWDDPVASWLDELKYGNFTLHGSISFIYKFKDFGNEDTRSGDWDYERSWLELGYKDDKWEAKVQYAFYKYENNATWITFIKKAWLQYTFDENNSLKGGITRVPFGITPYASMSWWESPAYYLGLEDDYDLGLVYSHKNEHWAFDLGYFPRDEGTWHSNGALDTLQMSFLKVTQEIKKDIKGMLEQPTLLIMEMT